MADFLSVFGIGHGSSKKDSRGKISLAGESYPLAGQ